MPARSSSTRSLDPHPLDIATRITKITNTKTTNIPTRRSRNEEHKTMTRLTCALLVLAGALLLDAQAPGPGGAPVLFEGARLIAGDGRPAIENATFLVEG